LYTKSTLPQSLKAKGEYFIRFKIERNLAQGMNILFYNPFKNKEADKFHSIK